VKKKSLDEESLKVWKLVLESPSAHGGHYWHTLASLGNPISVRTQIVAGTNYRFLFKDGSIAEVFYASWQNTLELTKLEIAEDEDQTTEDKVQTVEEVGQNAENGNQTANDEVQTAVDDIQTAEEDQMPGGWSGEESLDEQSLKVWKLVLESPSAHGGNYWHTLASLGNPISVRTQIVAGTNYRFLFEDGSIVEVFYAPWQNALEVTKLEISSEASAVEQQVP